MVGGVVFSQYREAVSTKKVGDVLVVLLVKPHLLVLCWQCVLESGRLGGEDFARGKLYSDGALHHKVVGLPMLVWVCSGGYDSG